MARKTDLKKIKEKIGLFKKEMKKRGFGDARYILFGSWAKGRQGEWSDIDLCVVSDKFNLPHLNPRP